MADLIANPGAPEDGPPYRSSASPRASYGEGRRQRRLPQPGVSQRLAVKDTRLQGRRLAAGSRLVVTIGVGKQPDRQLNLGSGKDPSDETIADAGTPLEIAWRGSSCLTFGVRD